MLMHHKHKHVDVLKPSVLKPKDQDQIKGAVLCDAHTASAIFQAHLALLLRA